MVGGWIYIVINQVNGVYFDQRYPKCNETFDAFQLAKEHFGDGVCFGGPLNTLGCEFEDGDCVGFNLAFPLCKGDNRTDVQTRVGDGNCDKDFMSSDCDYDGGDCCPYEIINNPSFGDGTCDKKANTEGCGYDNGDCIEYNRDYSGCPFDVVFGNPLFGNGECHGGIASTQNCSHDNGDCNDFILTFPNCPLDDLSQVKGADDVVIGDGICDSGIYNLEECGYEFGDCNYGQVGQHLSITEVIEVNGYLEFRKALSLDGMTMALGLSLTNEDGSFASFIAPGLVKIWRYNSIRKMWLQLGRDIVGQEENDQIGYSTSLSANGNRLMISSYSGGIRIYDFNVTSDDWIQVGQTVTSRLRFRSTGIMTSDGLKVALLYSEDEIRIYDVDKSSYYDVIEPSVDLLYFIFSAKFNTKDSSRLLLSADGVTKVYGFKPDNTPKSWTQIGEDIIIPSSTHPYTYPSSIYSSPAISADGNRIAVSLNATSTNQPGQVNVYDYDAMDNAWVPVGGPIKSSSSSNGDSFGSDIELSSEGNLLVIASNDHGCQRVPDEFSINNVCSQGSIEVYNFHPKYNRFQKSPPTAASPFKANGNILILADLVSNNAIFGLHFSMDGDGSALLISGYNIDDKSAFVESYDLNEFFSTRCLVDRPDWIGNGKCNDFPPYNTEKCGFDGGDCDRNPVEGYPDCFVHFRGDIGDGRCNDYPPYNSEECEFDIGDCDRNPVEGYPDCFVYDTDLIGNGECDDDPPHNTEECGFDGGDCERYPVEGYPDCFVYYTYWVGDGHCDDSPPYNTKECGFDGGDCL